MCALKFEKPYDTTLRVRVLLLRVRVLYGNQSQCTRSAHAPRVQYLYRKMRALRADQASDGSDERSDERTTRIILLVVVYISSQVGDELMD